MTSAEPCLAESAWVVCPQQDKAPIRLIRIMESLQAYDGFYDEAESVSPAKQPRMGPLPLDGTYREFDDDHCVWSEIQGGLFTGYPSIRDYAFDVLRFDEQLCCWLTPWRGAAQEIWPIQVRDFDAVDSLNRNWPESMARVLASVPKGPRGNVFLRVPVLLRSRFTRWCRQTVDSLTVYEFFSRCTQGERDVILEGAEAFSRFPEI